MARTVPTAFGVNLDGEPYLVAGDSWEFDIPEHPDFPIADGWSLTYALVGPSELALGGSHITESGTTYEVRVPAATTADLLAGRYRWQARVTDGTDSFTVASGQFDVRGNLATTAASETHNEEMLRLVRAALVARATNTVESFTINGRASNLIPTNELQRMETKYEARVALEREGGRIRTLGVAFVNPR